MGAGVAVGKGAAVGLGVTFGLAVGRAVGVVVGLGMTDLVGSGTAEAALDAVALDATGVVAAMPPAPGDRSASVPTT